VKPKSKVAGSGRGRTPVVAAKRLGKSLKRLAKNTVRTLSSSLPLKGKKKAAKKK